VHDPVKAELRAGLPADQKEWFERFAPPAGRDPLITGPEAVDWAERLAAAARRTDPLADPLAHVDQAPRAIHLLHGREDDLIPFTETLRLSRATSERWPSSRLQTAVTRLFSHSSEDRHPVRAISESVRFARSLSRVLGMVDEA
jgi:hypothetical protein